MKRIYKKNNLTDLKERASKRKNNEKYRHIPNSADIIVANEHAKLLETEQYRTFKNN